jgi:hypothetical protein
MKGAATPAGRKRRGVAAARRITEEALLLLLDRGTEEAAPLAAAGQC